MAIAHPQVGFNSGPPPLTVTPLAVDFGFIAPGEKRKATVTLTNISSTDITLVAVQPTCACTTTTDMAGKFIPAGGSVQFDAELGASVVPGPRHATVKVLAEGFGRALEMDVRGEVALPLRAVPSSITPPENAPAKGRVVVESVDRKPFRVLTANGGAPVFMGFDPIIAAPRATYVLRYDLTAVPHDEWPAFWVVETDRVDCPVLGLKVRDQRFASAPVMRMHEYALNLGVLHAGEPKDFSVDLAETITLDMLVRGGGNMKLQLLGTAPLSDGTRMNFRITAPANALGTFVVPLQISDGARLQPLFAYGVVRAAEASKPARPTEAAAPNPPPG